MKNHSILSAFSFGGDRQDRSSPLVNLAIALAAASVLCMQMALPAAPPTDRESNSSAKTLPDDSRTADAPAAAPVPIAVARDHATLLQQVYLSTQDVMHRRYFHGGKATVPARAMEDIFSDINQLTGAEAKWISVTLEPMSINHRPKTAFEKQASRELKSGKTEIELIDDGYYRRAVAVSLSGCCIHCHAGLVSRPPAKPVAGLVISIPIKSSSD